ncbi:phosphopantetheine-binding protein [bacterium]|nr:acyl carrier protein [bacterium]MCG2677743.1 phosphopantetheine-binding protein [bacterium]
MTEDLQSKIKELIVKRLKLEIKPEEIDSTAPLFGTGLGLDSIDALELVVGLEQEFGIKVKDEEVGKEIFASVNTLVEYVKKKKGEEG